MADPQYTLLIVDDNEDNLDMLARRLRRKGYAVRCASSGQQALAQLQAEGADLVILDVMMPGMSGLEVVERIRKQPRLQSLPVIMATAKADSEDVVRALDLGADDYVAKPIDVDVLLARVRAQLRGKHRQLTGHVPQAAAPATPNSSPEVQPGAGPAGPQLSLPPPATDGSHDATGAAPLGPGSILDGRYQLESVLGNGGFGVVYRARHLHMDRPVAVKLVHRHLLSRTDVVRRFQREAMSGCRVRHPNAVAILDAGVASGGPYLVMELLEGNTLEQEIVSSRRLSLPRAAQIVGPLCDALITAHEAGIIHRDIKPANILLSRQPEGEVVKVLDFGIATIVEAGGRKRDTVEGIIGTPAFMAPERLTGGVEDARSDVYGVGATVYCMLTGVLPHDTESDNPLVQALAQLRTPPTPINERRRSIPTPVAAIVMAALATDPSQRPTLAQFRRDFLKAVEGSQSKAGASGADSGMFAPVHIGRSAFGELETLVADKASRTEDPTQPTPSDEAQKGRA